MIDPDVLFGITTYKPSLPSATNYSQFRAPAHRHTSTPPTHCRPILHLSGSLVARLRIILFTERGKDAPRGLERPAGVQDGPVVDEEDVAVLPRDGGALLLQDPAALGDHVGMASRRRRSRPSRGRSGRPSTRCRRPPCC